MTSGGEPPPALFFDSVAELRQWYEANHATARELWLGLWKKASGRTGVSYAEAVDEALCFGWIDSLARRIDEASYAQRFTPRRPGSNWTATNVRRAQELSAAARMHPAGLAALAARRR